ncbi:MAG: NADH-quinone oxidoreductase subunit NuoE [Firmicutes bacterium]|nr:NADH-quinone oxidoreductase subunit NuoE [Bacillota bacterium]MCL5039796.1 NADH-quinone oxidoreductase subunit NuoE [Bacillota bacterium]
MSGHDNTEAKSRGIEDILTGYQGRPGALIPVLQETQEVFGYLSRENMEKIAGALHIPFSKVYGVATFYAQFHLKPRGRNIIRVCLGTACHVRGGEKILDAVSKELNIKPGETTKDLQFTLERVACLGACGLAPTLMVNNETHGRMKPENVPALIQNYRGRDREETAVH